MSAANKVTDINEKRAPHVDITRLYEILAGKRLDGDSDERRGFCLNPEHSDTDPSCDYNVTKRVYHCHSCGSAGSAFQLVELAGAAKGKAAIVQWLRDQGLLAPKVSSAPPSWSDVDLTYDYVDENGSLLYQVGRWNNPKHFSQRIPDGKGGWVYKLDGVRKVPYMLPSLVPAVARGETIYVVEGEKDADNLFKLGLMATTSAQGAKWKWPLEWASFFDGAARVFVIADNDPAGLEAARWNAGVIARSVPETYLIERMPGVEAKGDISDWLDAHPSATAKEVESEVAELGVKATPYTPAYPPEALEALEADMSDMGLGTFMAAVRGPKLRHISDLDTLARYRQGVWTWKEVSAQHEIAKTFEALDQAALDSKSEDLRKFVKAARNGSTPDIMLKRARGKLGLFSRFFDQHPKLLNVEWATLNLDNIAKRQDQTPETPESERFVLRGEERKPEYYLTQKAPIEYDAAATCPEFEKWLLRCCSGDNRTTEEVTELVDYMQQVMGACLEARSGERRFFFIYGPKGTGKSTFIRTLEALLGADYAAAIDINTLTETKYVSDGNSATPALAALDGKRLATVAETKDAPLNAARVKQLIGGDTVTARDLHAKQKQFRVKATLVMIGNKLPSIPLDDDAMWEKLMPVPFTRKIEKEDASYEERVLHPELPGILNFALAGLEKLRERNHVLTEPECVRRLREEKRSEQDPFRDFADECLIFSDRDDAVTPFSDIKDAYKQWCGSTLENKISDKMLGTWLTKRAAKDKDSRSSLTIYRGVLLKYRDPKTGMPPPEPDDDMTPMGGPPPAGFRQA